MAERSFVEEVEKLKLGDGEVFRGEGILAVAKALLQSGVSYVGGYQGAPISHLMDVFTDADGILSDLGVHFEQSASEATAAAMLAASVNYPLRGAVTWKSTAGTNVASDALANIASSGVKGGALIVVGEDYGEGASIMQERTHAFAMKSQIWLLDPRPNLQKIVELVEHGFALSEASNTPVMLEMRIRACHMHGRFTAKGNQPPAFKLQDALNNPSRDVNRIVLPPASFQHEHEKVSERWPAAAAYVQRHQLNEQFEPADTQFADLGIIVQGGLYNTLMRALALAGLADYSGNTAIPIYVLNVTYPIVDEEVARFCNSRRAVLIVEEGQPEFIEQAISATLRKLDHQCRIHGKDILPQAGEYTGQVLQQGIDAFMATHTARKPAATPIAPILSPADVPLRPVGFCTGCPERPVFTAMKLLQREIGDFHVACDIGCHLFSILPPFNIGSTTMGYGLGAASAAAFGGAGTKRRAVSVMGDGGFWHNGLTSGVANAVFNQSDNVLVIIDNGYSAATGGQDIPSSRGASPRSVQHRIEDAVRGVGVQWVRTVETYKLKSVKAALKDALTTSEGGPKVIIAQSECMLNRQRREKPLFAKDVAKGARRIRQRFGVDEDICTGDHSCIRLSGCPSLTIKPNPDPLREDPVASVNNDCVGCGVCGEIAHAAVLCPSFYRVDEVFNPTRMEKIGYRIRSSIISVVQRWAERTRAARMA